VRSHADVVVRDGRVVFKLLRPHTHFDLLLANHNAPIVAEGPLPLGTGPYRLEPGPPARLLRNPHHPLRAAVEEVQVDVYPVSAGGQPQALIDAVNDGRVDYTHHVPYSALNQLKNVRKMSSLGYCTCSLFFNTERPPLSDVRVRRSLARAVDRQGIAAACYTNPLAFVARGLLPPLVGRGEDGITHDPAEARRMLRDAGVTAPARPLSLLVMPLPRPYLPDPQAVARRLADDFAAVGWRVEPKLPSGLPDYLAQASSTSHDMMLQGWNPDSQDPLEYIEVHVASHAIPTRPEDIFRLANLARYRNPVMDKALAKHRSDGDASSWQTILQLLASDVPLLPIMYGPSVAVMSWRIVQRPKSLLYRPFLAELALRD
jgi:cationic peptide transport system substrate-binding protein